VKKRELHFLLLKYFQIGWTGSRKPSRITVMVRIARANRVAIQKVFPTRNLWYGQPQDAGAEPAASPKQK
jgi:hypothetical protein